MSSCAIDASVVLKLVSPAPERHAGRAERVADAALAGSLRLHAPSFLDLELLNVGARKWHLGEAALRVLLEMPRELGIRRLTLDLDRVARWAARGLSAYDAAYVAVADGAGMPLVTDDDQLVALAPGVAVSLAAFDPTA